MKYLVIDFGGTFVKYSVMDKDLHVYARGETPAPLESKEQFVETICNLYSQHGGEDMLSGIAISMPGILDEKNGEIHTAGAYFTLRGENVFALLKDKIAVPVSLENDGKCGALAEVWQGNLKDCQDGIVLILGTGIAGGIIKDRKIHKGKNLSAGEFSYIVMGDEPGLKSASLFKCSVSCLLLNACLAKGIDIKKSPNYGTLSRFMEFEQELTEWNDKPEFQNGIDGYKFFELLENGDEEIGKIYHEFTYNIAKMALNLQTIYAPEKILIGGGISRQDRLVKDVRTQYEKLEKYFEGIMTIPCVLDICKLTNEANQYGALYNFFQQQEDEAEC